MASAFASGFKMGGDLYADSERIALAKKADQRAQESHDTSQREAGLRLKGAQRVEDATNEVSNLYQYGAPDQAAQQANAGLQREALMRSERGGEYAAPAGLQPAYRPATADDRNAAFGRLAAAKGDTAGAMALEDRKRVSDMDRIAAEAMKIPLKDIETMIPTLNTNHSSVPMLYTGKDKRGYTFLTTDDKGNPGKPVTMNEAQVRQLYLANKLGEAGFGKEAMATLASTHKDIADHIGKWNEAITKVATVNNTGTHFGNADANDAARTAATAQYYKDRTSMDRMGAAQYFTGDDGNTYASIPVMGKKGLEFQTVQVNPDGVGLKKPGAKAGNPKKVEEEGTKVKLDDGSLRVADGNGNYLDPKGVVPSAREALLRKSGLPDNLIGQVQWSEDGTKLRIGPWAADAGDAKAIKELAARVKQLAANEVARSEESARTVGIHQRSNAARNPEMYPGVLYPRDGMYSLDPEDSGLGLRRDPTARIPF